MIARQRLWTAGTVSTMDTGPKWRLMSMRRTITPTELVRGDIRDGREWIEDTDAPAHRCPPICAATHRR